MSEFDEERFDRYYAVTTTLAATALGYTAYTSGDPVKSIGAGLLTFVGCSILSGITEAIVKIKNGEVE